MARPLRVEYPDAFYSDIPIWQPNPSISAGKVFLPQVAPDFEYSCF